MVNISVLALPLWAQNYLLCLFNCLHEDFVNSFCGFESQMWTCRLTTARIWSVFRSFPLWLAVSSCAVEEKEREGVIECVRHRKGNMQECVCVQIILKVEQNVDTLPEHTHTQKHQTNLLSPSSRSSSSSSRGGGDNKLTDTRQRQTLCDLWPPCVWVWVCVLYL